jgi:hypothetical protein
MLYVTVNLSSTFHYSAPQPTAQQPAVEIVATRIRPNAGFIHAELTTDNISTACHR